ncbi:hypothetical protein Tco_0687602 [Tanacetum coccineum]|uniref:Uncharacterized protein n=1 Tax=Tanacetum coccineum TaxID=301880 RepID=A0ABQ5CQT3_9ASTR
MDLVEADQADLESEIALHIFEQVTTSDKLPLSDMAPLPPRDHRHLWLHYQVEGYTEEIVHDFKQRLETIFALGLHTAEEMAEDRFGAYWLGSERLILDKGDLSDYWVKISSGRDFLRGAPSYTYIRDPVRRHTEGRKSVPRLFRRSHYLDSFAHHFGLVSDDGLRGLFVMACELPLIGMGKLVKLNICIDLGYDWVWVAPGPERQQALQQPPPPPPVAARTMP